MCWLSKTPPITNHHQHHQFLRFFCRSVLGDKIAAGILAQTAGVPSIPWSGDGLTAELTSEGTIPDSTFKMPGLEDGEAILVGPLPLEKVYGYVFKGRAMSLVGFAEKNSNVVVFPKQRLRGAYKVDGEEKSGYNSPVEVGIRFSPYLQGF